MKSCPTCHRTFEDTFSFCLVDGAILSPPFDPEATKTSPGSGGDVKTEVLYSRDTLPSPTIRSTAPPNPPLAGPVEPQAATLRSTEPASKKAGPNRFAQLILGVIPATVIVILAPRFLPATLIASYVGVVLAVVIRRKLHGLPAAMIAGFMVGYFTLFLGLYLYSQNLELPIAGAVFAAGSWALTRLIGLVLRVVPSAQ